MAHGEGETKRSLSARHLEMIAIGGTIGTGLFLGSGGALASAGPGGALFAYSIVGFFVFFVVCSLGEMAAYIPVSGSFNEYAARFVDQSLGFTMGWNYWFSWAITLPAEMTASALIMHYWFPDTPGWIWGAIVLVLTTLINLVGVRFFGEVEFCLSLIKVIAVVLFIIIGIVTVVRKEIGFSNWRYKESPFVAFPGGTLKVFLTAFFSYGGTELVGITGIWLLNLAGEAANPAKTIPKAIKGTFYRILIFYTGAIFIMGLLLPYDSPELQLEVSPFTLGLQLAGIPGSADCMNAVILVALLSAANSSMYAASRTLMALAHENKAPKIFGRTVKGVPIYAMIPSIVFGLVFVIISNLGAGAALLFDWLLNITGFTVVISWCMICVIHLRFRAAFKAQGYLLTSLPYVAPFFPYGDWIAIVGASAVIIGQGVTLGMSSQASDPLVWAKSYVGVLLFPILYFTHKFWTKSKIVPLMECDFISGQYVEPVEERFEVGAAHEKGDDKV